MAVLVSDTVIKEGEVGMGYLLPFGCRHHGDEVAVVNNESI